MPKTLNRVERQGPQPGSDPGRLPSGDAEAEDPAAE